MITSFRNDLRAGKTPLLLVAGGFLSIVIASLVLQIKAAVGIAPLLLLVGCHYLGALPLGHEYDHRTWALQLTQPSARWKLWSSKLTLSFLIILSIYVATVLLMELTEAGDPSIAWFFAALAAAAFSGPPLFVQYTRNTLGAAAVSFLALVLLISGTSLSLELFLQRFYPITGRNIELTMQWVLYSYSVGALVLATWKWKRFEVRDPVTRPSLGPSRFWARGFLALDRSRPTRNIWQREFALQSRGMAFGIAFAVLLWIDVQLLKRPTWSPYAASVLPLLILVPSWIVPLFAGLVCGTGRFEGTQFLMLSQPYAIQTQIRIRLAMGLITAALFGIVVSFWGMSATHLALFAAGAGMDRLLVTFSALLCFAAGWFSCTVCNTSLAAAGTAASIIGAILGLLTWIHQAAIPWLVVFSGLVQKPTQLLPEWGPATSYWNVGFLIDEVHDHPANHLWFTTSLLAFVLGLMVWIVRQARYDHTPKIQSAKYFGLLAGSLFLVHWIMGAWLCWRFLQN